MKPPYCIVNIRTYIKISVHMSSQSDNETTSNYKEGKHKISCVPTYICTHVHMYVRTLASASLSTMVGRAVEVDFLPNTVAFAAMIPTKVTLILTT